MKQYERPEILVSYTVEELVEEAAVCVFYDGTGDGDDDGGGGGGGGET
ncbi:MAG TPA: hypothetical protein VFU22_16990 [Roseiflexaceae bacterium]|nr:hypothetical protein [Roseiflexaceae bacterium]